MYVAPLVPDVPAVPEVPLVPDVPDPPPPPPPVDPDSKVKYWFKPILKPAKSEPIGNPSNPGVALENSGDNEPVVVKSTIAIFVSAVWIVSPESASIPSSPHSIKNDNFAVWISLWTTSLTLYMCCLPVTVALLLLAWAKTAKLEDGLPVTDPVISKTDNLFWGSTKLAEVTKYEPEGVEKPIVSSVALETAFSDKVIEV